MTPSSQMMIRNLVQSLTSNEDAIHLPGYTSGLAIMRKPRPMSILIDRGSRHAAIAEFDFNLPSCAAKMCDGASLMTQSAVCSREGQLAAAPASCSFPPIF
jgi:hypothetical protein